jgi:lipopolysaccharide/colanic/teichoic acid biosynthesis glycosyltransferase
MLGEHGRHFTAHEHPEHDLYYVRNACLGLDFEIIGQTVSFLLKGQNGA